MTPLDTPGPRPGTVAEEAALLVDLLSQRGWGGDSSRMPPAADDGHATSPGGTADERAGRTGPGDPGAEGRSGSSGAGECTCGGTTPAACRVCPVCQLIAFVQQVNPDTIEKVADFVGFAATALRDLATAQRERRAEPPARESSPATPSARSDAAPDTGPDTAPDTATHTTPHTAPDRDGARPGDHA